MREYLNYDESYDHHSIYSTVSAARNIPIYGSGSTDGYRSWMSVDTAKFQYCNFPQYSTYSREECRGGRWSGGATGGRVTTPVPQEEVGHRRDLVQ